MNKCEKPVKKGENLVNKLSSAHLDLPFIFQASTIYSFPTSEN